MEMKQEEIEKTAIKFMEIHFSSPNLANIYMYVRAYVWEKYHLMGGICKLRGDCCSNVYPRFSIFA